MYCIQLYSYVISNHVGRLGHFSMACSMYGAMLRFFTVNHKDVSTHQFKDAPKVKWN